MGCILLRVTLHQLSQDHTSDGIEGHLNAWGPFCGGWGHMLCCSTDEGQGVHILPSWMHACVEALCFQGRRVEGLLWTRPRMTCCHLFNHMYPFFPIRQELVPRSETTCTTFVDICAQKYWIIYWQLVRKAWKDMKLNAQPCEEGQWWPWTVLNSTSPKLMSTQDLRMWLYLEICSLQMSLVKMRSYWIRVGLIQWLMSL